MNVKPLAAAHLLLLAACGTDVSGPSGSLFSCLLAEPADLEVGEVVPVRGEANRGLCLAGGGGGAEFVYIPFFAQDPPEEGSTTLSLTLAGAGVRTVTGPPSPAPANGTALLGPAGSGAGSALRFDEAFHRSLRRSEAQELAPRLRTGPAPSPGVQRAIAADVPQVGDLLTFNVAISCTEEDLRTGRVEWVSGRAIVVADVENPSGLTALDYRHFALTFDTLVDPIEVAHFGEPTDIDENGRSILFFTRAVNELAAPSEGTFTAGFFWSGDLFPEEDTERAQACPAANHAEMFYLLSADPFGVAGPMFDVDFVREAAVGIIGHEYQHLINASRRLWVNEASTFEEPWLNEGLSHAAEELLFYGVSGLQPGTNIDYQALVAAPSIVDAFNRYMAGNFTNFSRYLREPESESLMGRDLLPTRGAAWNFVRYAADRSGRPDDEFLKDLVNARVAGLDNLREVIGEDPLGWMRDWTVSVYADDVVPVADRYTLRSWNLRDVYARSTIGEFPLEVIPLSSGAERSISLEPGGAVFVRFGLDAGTAGVLEIDAGGEVPPATLRGSFLRTR